MNSALQKTLVELLYSTKIFFYSLLWLIVLLVLGTLAQRNMGIFSAQEIYFSSWILWMKGLPLPGGRLILVTLFINLFFKLILDSPWKKNLTGVIIAHMGALLLLGGGFITAYSTTQGSMVLPEGAISSYYDSYQHKELAFIDPSPTQHDSVIAFSKKYLKPGAVIEDPSFPARIQVTHFFKNCNLIKRGELNNNGYRGFAQRFMLKEAPPQKEDERNIAGIILEVSGLAPTDNGIYMLYENLEIPQTLTMGDRKIQLALRPKRHMLPFEIQLLDFEKTMYPGTDKARSYSSAVNIIDQGIERVITISMNHPLRNRGYTFYQASFIEGAESETSVLAVVRNVGRLFPYISSIVICLGLIIHLLLKLPKLIRNTHLVSVEQNKVGTL